MKAWLLLLLALLLPPAVGAQGAGETPVRGIGMALEGDLVQVEGRQFRLFGIDAPDLGQTCRDTRGREYDCFNLATGILSRLINDRNIECTPHLAPSTGTSAKPSAAGGPTLAVCRAENGDDLAYAMVERGMALAYRPISMEYVRIETRAIAFRRGLWAGRVEAPWLWRSRQLDEKLDKLRKPKKKPAAK